MHQTNFYCTSVKGFCNKKTKQLHLYIYIYIYIYIYASLIKKNGTLVVYDLFTCVFKKIINNECAILFNKTCINERLLPKNIYIYIYKQSFKLTLVNYPKIMLRNNRIMLILTLFALI